MQSDDEDDASDFDLVEDEFLESLLEGAKEIAAKRSKARAYEIRRQIEDLQEKRRFHELYEDFE